MAEPISIQQLKDASLDAKTLEQAVNGDAVTTVVSRLGETYPSLSNALNQIDSKLDSADTQIKQGITNLFENGGLPATPFATKALMQSSALVDGDYAMVTDGAADNGLYVKTAGAWVKSGYDPLAQANTYTDNKVKGVTNNFKTEALMTASTLPDDSYAMVTEDTEANNGLYVKTAGAWVKSDYNPAQLVLQQVKSKYRKNPYEKQVFSMTFTNDGFIDRVTGLPVANVNWMYSEGFLAVNEGDFLVVDKQAYYYADNHNTENTAQVAFYDGSKVYESYLGAVNEQTDGFFLNSERRTSLRLSLYGNSEKGNNLIVVRAPKNGFVRISVAKGEEPIIYKVYPNFVADVAISAAPQQFMRDFLLKAKSIEGDINLTKKRIDNTQTIGASVSYVVDSRVSVSKKIPINKGQYFSLQTQSYNQNDVIFEDGNGTYQGMRNNSDEFSVVGDEAALYTNIQSPVNGFVRVNFNNNTAIPLFYKVHDSKIDKPVRDLRNVSDILFYKDATLTLGTNASPAYLSGESAIQSYLSSNVSASANHSRSIPYLLKKGEVLEYCLDKTISPILGIAFPVGFSDRSRAAVTLLDTSLVSVEEARLHRAAPIDNEKTFYSAEGRSAKSYYCNDDEDMLIVLFKPSETSSDFSEYKLSTGYSVRVIDKDEYISIRDDNLTAWLSTLSGVTAVGSNGLMVKGNNPATSYRGSLSNVLIFNGEVLDLLVGNNVRITGVQKSLGNSNINATSEILFSTTPNLAAATLVFDEADPRTCSSTQTFAKRTCNVVLSFNVMDDVNNSILLDKNAVISGGVYKPSVYDLKKENIDKISPTFLVGTARFINSVTLLEQASLPSNRQLISTFLPKGAYVEITVVNSSLNSTYFSPLERVNGQYLDTRVSIQSPELNPISLVSYPFAELYNENGYDPSYVRWAKTLNGISVIGFHAPCDGLLTVVQGTISPEDANFYKDKTEGLDLSPIYDYAVVNVSESQNYGVPFIRDAFKKPSVVFISKEDYQERHVVTSDEFMYIPDTANIIFDFNEPVSESLVASSWGVLNIKQNGRILVTVNAKTENQGQSSAAYPRKNINVEMYNSKGDKFYIKFGDNPKEQEIVLKSYYASDKGLHKDGLASDFWLKLRRSHNNYLSSPFPESVFSDLNSPNNIEARGTPFSFPVQVNKGGHFYSMAAIRTKKKRENYCISKSNPNHILMQIDYTLRAVDFATLQLGNFELREPSIKGYTAGESSLPVGNEALEGKVTRIINYMKDCFNNTVDVKTTASDYLNIDSFIDYIISLNCLGNWDGMTNNFLLGSYDGNLWYVFQYDTDKTFGANGAVEMSPNVLTENLRVSFFKTFATAFKSEISARYRYLRAEKVIDVREMRERILDVNHKFPEPLKKLDAVYWGEIPYAASAPYSMDWFAKRVIYLDNYYGYNVGV